MDGGSHDPCPKEKNVVKRFHRIVLILSTRRARELHHQPPFPAPLSSPSMLIGHYRGSQARQAVLRTQGWGGHSADYIILHEFSGAPHIFVYSQSSKKK